VPSLEAFALPVVVLGVTVIVLGLREAPIVDNALAWFLGLVTFFAAHRAPSAGAVGDLAATSMIGGIAGWLCVTLTGRWTPHHEARRANPAA